MSEPHPRDLPDLKAPPARLLLMELRVLAEIPLFVLRTLSVAGLPRGDGHGVIVVPGFGAGDVETVPLRRALSRLGYDVHGWGCGRNLGMRSDVREALPRCIAALNDRTGGKVSLIGWSLGGVFVREMARKTPDRVRQVFTLGSPFNGRPDANNMNALFKLANRGQPVKLDWDGFRRRIAPPPVPCTAIFTRSDGIVAWRASIENELPNTENVEVRGSHFGLPFNREVLAALAMRLPRHAGG